MTIGCNIWMICLELNFSISCFNSFLLIDETDRSKISSDQKRLFFAVSLYPLLFFANTPFKNVQEATWVFDILDTKYIPSSPIGCKNWKSWFLSGVIVNDIAAKSMSLLVLIENALAQEKTWIADFFFKCDFILIQDYQK